MSKYKVVIQLLDKNGDVQYGLNWGQREKRDPNQAYLQLTPEIYKSDFFPEKGSYFIVTTDDHQTLILNRAQKGYGTALQTPENNAIIGKYIRQRLGVESEKEITKEAIKAYGRDSIDIYKIDNIHFTMDFSVASSIAYIPTDSLQQIYFGAPGTGKSHEIKLKTKGKQVIRTTFHPDSDYSTFVGAYKPTTKKDEKIVYEFVQQAFLQAYTNAWREYANVPKGVAPKEQYLVIEEINRGNCAQIFGDLFQLLDRNDSGFSEYPITADSDMKKQLAKSFDGLKISQSEAINSLYDEDDIVRKVLCGEVLLLPNNLYIWATMNTSDQSLFPIDSAFKRRWDWKYMPLHNAEMNWIITVNGMEYDWWNFLERVNDYIGNITNSEDKKLGYFFCNTKDGRINADTFVGKVCFYLWNDVFKIYGFDDPLFKCSDGSTLTFDKFYGAEAGTIREEKVEQFLTNLGLERITGDDEEEDEGLSDDVDFGETPKRQNRTFLSVNYKGQIIEEETGKKTFVRVINKFIEDIGGSQPLIDLGIKRGEYALFAKEQIKGDREKDIDARNSQVLSDSGDCYILTKTNTADKVSTINVVAKRLEIKDVNAIEKETQK